MSAYQPACDNFESYPAHLRFVLGPTDWIALGWNTDANGAIVQHVIGDASGFLNRIDFDVIGRPPHGSPLIVDIQRSTDQGATWESVFSDVLADMPHLPDRAMTARVDIGVPVALNDYVRLKVVQVGAFEPGTNINVKILGFFID